MSENEKNYISRQISVYKTDKKLVEFIDKLKPAPAEYYAHIHSFGDKDESGVKQISCIGITLQNYTNGTGKNIKRVSANISPYEAEYIFNQLQNAVQEFNFQQEKIFGTLTNTEMMLPKSEALQYKSLKTQLDELQETYAKGNITFPTVVKHNNNTWDFYAKTGNIKSVLASLKLSIEEISDELIRYTKNCRNDDAEKTDQDAIVNAINNNQPVTPEMYEMFEDKYCQYPKFREADGTAAENTPRVSGTDLYEMFRQRNLMLLQLQTQEEQLQKQENLVTKQIELIKNKKTLYVEQVQNYYKEYKIKQLNRLRRGNRFVVDISGNNHTIRLFSINDIDDFFEYVFLIFKHRILIYSFP